jgi:hypothetical protein
MTAHPRIALVHPLQPAVRAAEDAFRAFWPQARCINLMDDSLPDDLLTEGPASPSIRRRITALLAYAAGLQVAGILFTGSGFGPLLDELAPTLPVPLLKPNQAMYEDALKRGGPLGMLVTFPSAVDAMRLDFSAAARAARVRAELEIACVPEALACLRQGKAAEHDRLLASASSALAHCSAILLAQFSSARAADAVAAASGREVLTSPGSAVKRLREIVEAR